MFPVSSLLINFVFFWFLSRFLISKSPKALNYVGRFIKGSLIVALVWLVGTSFGYLFTPLYFDHGEAAVASIGASWIRGLPIYTDMDAPYRYSLLYGPLTMMIVGWMQGLGSNTILLAKIPSVFCLISTLLIFFRLLGSLNLSKFQRFLALGALAVSLVGMYHFSYWTRPDPYILLFVMVALFAVERWSLSGRNSFQVYLTLGLLVGLSINAKVHSPIYFLPLVFYYLEAKKRLMSVKALAVGFAGGLFSLVFPYLFSGVSFLKFTEWINMALTQGLVPDMAIKNITYLLPFLLVLWGLGAQRKYKKTFFSVVVSSLLVAIISSKPGSGIQMFMPLFPIYFWMMGKIYADMDWMQKDRVRVLFGALFLMLSLNACNRQKQVVHFFSQTPMRWAEFNDLKLISEGVEGPLELGFSGIEQYESTFYKSWLVMAGKGLLIEGAALMETEYTKIPFPEKVVTVLDECLVPTIIIPNGGEPWGVRSYYDDQPLFSESFKNTFAEKFRLIKNTAYFQVYSCKPNNGTL